ncbi:MAG: FtsX-like permease family protein [Lachnospiraceae bacterium]|nr:FtsX-like permease family protein [Lachnospiraceae bacterium]
MFFKYIRRNYKRNYKENSIFFLSLVVAIVAFYVVLSLEKQDVITFLRGMESDAVNKLLGLIPAVYGFSLFLIFFLIYFAAKYQMERRNHEFGTMMMFGMKRSRLFLWLLAEDIYSSIWALGIGLPVAVLLSEVVSLVTVKIIGVGIIGHQFTLSLKGIVFTVLGFAGIKMFANVLLSSKMIKKEPASLMNDIQEEKQKEIRQRRSAGFLVLGILLLASAYTLAIRKYTWTGIGLFSLTMVLGISGTFLLFKGVCAIFTVMAEKGKAKERLFRFTFRQLQENVFLCANSLCVSSLFILVAVACMSYGVAVSIQNIKDGSSHSMDFTFESYDEASAKEIEMLSQQKEIQDKITSWSKVRVAYLKTDEWGEDTDRMHHEYDTSDLDRAVAVLPEEEQEVFSTYYAYMPHLIALSGYNEILKNAGKEPIQLGDDEMAVFQDSEFCSGESEKLFESFLEQKPELKIDGKPYRLKEKVYSEDIVVDRSITMRFALIVPDAKFDEFVSAGSISIYWNAYIDSGLVEEKGLMKAISLVDAEMKKSGLEYENYLQNMGRQLFYVVASSYLTIYLAVIFLIIANTVIGLQFLMREEKTRKRYHTLVCLGSSSDDICRSSERQIKWYFQIPIGVAAISGIFGVWSLFSGILPNVLYGEMQTLFLIAGIIIAILFLMEYSYMKMVMRISKRNIMGMMAK